MNTPDVVCLGEAMVEVALDRAQPDQARIGFAGDTFNTAVYLKRAAPALKIAYATKLGQDELSGRMVALMQEEDLATDLVLRSPTAMPGLYAISTDEDGERSFMYWRSASAARELFADPALSLETLARAPLLFFSAISLAILPDEDRERFLNWLPDYRAQGGRVAFDSNYRPALWRNAGTARDAIEAAWRATDLGLPSVDDEMDIFGDADEEAVLSRLRGWGVAAGALKRGSQGPRAIDGSPPGTCPPAPKMVDSTAAGDSFNAAFLAAILTGEDTDTAMSQGHALASKVIGAPGAILPREPVSAA